MNVPEHLVGTLAKFGSPAGRDEDCKHKVARWAPCKEESTVVTEEGSQWCLTKGEEGKARVDDVWRSHNFTFSAADVPGARYLRFEDGGVDSEYWTGWCGRGVSLSLLWDRGDAAGATWIFLQ